MITIQPSPPDEFYIGYSGEMPRDIGRRVRSAVVAIAAVSAIAVAVVALSSMRLPPSHFEFGVVTERTGILQRSPYPTIDLGNRRLLLVGRGKWGADRQLANMADGPVTVRGSRIQRGDREMLEVLDATPPTSPVTDPRTRRPVAPTSARRVTLRGEIVDSKCFLGVMNPGEGAVHRDCARRCLSGGMPPMLLVRDVHGRQELILLTSPDGNATGPPIAHAAGKPVEVSGLLIRGDDGYVLRVSSWKSPDTTNAVRD